MGKLDNKENFLLRTIGNYKDKHNNYPHIADIDKVVSKLYDAIEHIHNNGFIDYSDAGTRISPVVIEADDWTDLPNDGQTFINYDNKPSSVTDLLDVSTGYLDLTELTVGSELAVRTQFSITPSINNPLLQIRFIFSGGAFSFTKSLGRLDDGSGKEYEKEVTLPFYIGNDATLNNPVKIQIKLSTSGTLINFGSYVSVTKLK